MVIAEQFKKGLIHEFARLSSIQIRKATDLIIKSDEADRTNLERLKNAIDSINVIMKLELKIVGLEKNPRKNAIKILDQRGLWK